METQSIRDIAEYHRTKAAIYDAVADLQALIEQAPTEDSKGLRSYRLIVKMALEHNTASPAVLSHVLGARETLRALSRKED